MRNTLYFGQFSPTFYSFRLGADFTLFSLVLFFLDPSKSTIFVNVLPFFLLTSLNFTLIFCSEPSCHIFPTICKKMNAFIFHFQKPKYFTSVKCITLLFTLLYFWFVIYLLYFWDVKNESLVIFIANGCKRFNWV